MHWQQIDALSVSLTILSTKQLNVHSGKLAAIDASISQLLQPANKHALQLDITIFTDSLIALQALQKPGQQSGQSVLRNITYTARKIETMFIRRYIVQLQWCLRHSKDIENEMAHHLVAKSTKIRKVIQEDKITAPLLQAVALSIAFQIFICSTYCMTAEPKDKKVH